MLIVGGIDPGQQGYIVVIKELLSEKTVKVHFFPIPIETTKSIVYKKGKKLIKEKHKINLKELRTILIGFNFDLIYLEKVGAMPDQGTVSMFSFGEGYGIIQGQLSALEIPFELISPQSWKNTLMTKEVRELGKDSSIITSERLIDERNWEVSLPVAPRSKKVLNGATDAFCLAYLALLKIKGNI